MKNSLIRALCFCFSFSILLMVGGHRGFAAGEINAIPVLVVQGPDSSKAGNKAADSSSDSAQLKSVCYGLGLSAALALLAVLVSNSSLLQYPVWINHLTMVSMSALSLTLTLYVEAALSITENVGNFILILLRGQLILASIGIFARLKNAESKQHIGNLFSGLLGCVLSASLLDFFWPIDAFLVVAEMMMLMAAIVYGTKQYLNHASKTLFYQIVIVITMGVLVVWLPDLKTLSSKYYPVFAALQMILLASVGASIWSAICKGNAGKLAQMKKEIYSAEMRVLKQGQAIRMLQADCVSLEEKLKQEASVHRQDEFRDGLKIKALEEMSRDIGNGIVAYLKELDYGCQQIVSETKSNKFRLQRIRVYAEHASMLAVKVQDVMSFTRHHEDCKDGKLVNAGDLLKECLRLCHGKITRSSVEVEIESYDQDLWFKGKVSLLAQGFLGLLYNALEATESADVRRVTISLKPIRVDGSDWVDFAVSNSGSGIPTSIRSKVFHSRIHEALENHSLGLSMAFGIFETFGGSLRLDTEAVATTFVARLPLFDKDEEFSLRLAI